MALSPKAMLPCKSKFANPNYQARELFLGVRCHASPVAVMVRMRTTDFCICAHHRNCHETTRLCIEAKLLQLKREFAAETPLPFFANCHTRLQQVTASKTTLDPTFLGCTVEGQKLKMQVPLFVSQSAATVATFLFLDCVNVPDVTVSRRRGCECVPGRNMYTA